MKLLKCHIENFGKLSDFDYDFKKGLNTIIEENGFGKTTFASFIKAMFYGLEAKRSTKILIDRKKYKPWQGGAFGGNIEFELNRKKYRIERFFGNKESEDTFKLYDLKTNLEIDQFSKKIGEEIFKLNKEAYERSTFISGQNIETAMNDSINAKLGNILENENDVNTSEQAIKILDEAIKNYKKTGGRGEINEKIHEKTKLEQKLKQSKIDEKGLQDRKNKNEQLKKLIKEKMQEQEMLKKLITRSIEQETKKAKLENYKILQNNVEESKRALQIYEEFFKEDIPSDEEIDILIEKCLLLEKYKMEAKDYEISTLDSNDIVNLKQIFQDKNVSENIIDNKIAEYNNMKDIRTTIELNEQKRVELERDEKALSNGNNRRKIINSVLCISAIILILVAVITFFCKLKKTAIATALIGLIFLAIVVIRAITYQKKGATYLSIKEELQQIVESQENLKEQEARLQRSIEEFINEYSQEESDVDSVFQLTEIKSKYNRYKELESTINVLFGKQQEVVEKLNELESSIKDYLLRYFKKVKGSYTTYAQEIKMKKSEFTRQYQELEIKLKAKQEYERLNNTKDLEKAQNDTIDKKVVEKKIEIITNEINKLNDEKNYNKNQMEILESNIETVFDIENEIEELNQKIEEMKEDCEILEETKKYLDIAKSQFSSRYLYNMRKSFIKNLELINGKQLEIDLDVKLKVQIKEQGANKDVDYFSTGYKDLIYICMRLSLIDALFENEKPFIILDDPFVNLDENKIKNARSLLNQLSKKYQIIYFICHESRK